MKVFFWDLITFKNLLNCTDDEDKDEENKQKEGDNHNKDVEKTAGAGSEAFPAPIL